MPILKLPLKDRKVVAEDTMAFYFALEGKDFTFSPGQYISVYIPKLLYDDPKGNHRVFSIASSPNNKEYLLIATRMRGSGYKKTLKDIPLGSIVEIDGPFGSFVLPQNPTGPIVLIAGGIGITPFMSMVCYATEEKLPHKLILIYSNKTPESTAFLKELQELQNQNPNFKMIATITEPENAKSMWSGKIGKITSGFIKENIEDPALPVWYIAGPPDMVFAIKQALIEAGIDEDNIHFEDFGGY
ncbi:MAG: FAD-dependent oxidoreductase [Candidatus Paceibacteria bacterium]